MRRLLLTALSVCGMLSAAQAQVTFKCIGGTNPEEGHEGEGYEQAFDGNLETKWGMYSKGDKFAVVEATKPVYLTGYTLVNADNSDTQNIKEWEIFGTNDYDIAHNNTTKPDGWTRFERVREHNIGSNNYSAHHISLNPLSTAYKYIMFKRVAGSGDESKLSEISLAYSTTPDVRQEIGYTYIGGIMGVGDGEGADKVFDNHWNTKLCANTAATYYVTFTTNEEVNVSKVNMTTANDYEGRDPRIWSLYGSTDGGTTWERIYNHDGDMPTGFHKEKTFEVPACSKAYQLFKLEIYYTRDGNNEKTMQISELSLNENAGLTYVAQDATGGGVNDGEGAQKLFDGDVNSKWCCKNSVWKNWCVEFTTDKVLAPTGYYFTTANDYKDRDPKAWTLYGSADNGATWIALDTKTDQTFPDMRREYVEYTMTQPSTPYSRYKLVVTERRGNGDGLVQFGEFGLLTDTNGNLANNNHIIVYEGSGGSASESVQKMFDGVAETKWCAAPTSTVFGVGHKAKLYGYGIHMADENGNYNRRPKKWTLQGSDNYSDWVDIDNVENDTKLPENYLTLAYYPLDAPVEYKYYKFTIKEMQGASIFQIGEFVPVFDGGMLNKLELRDGTEPTFCGNATVGEFVYDRTVTAGNVATFILPVEIPVGNVNGTVWQLDTYTGSALKFSKVENGTLAANKPYLVQPSSDGPLLGNKLENVRLYAAPGTEGLKKATTDGGAYQMGTYATLKSETINDGTVYGYTGGKFVQAKSGTLNPFRTLFVVKEDNGAAAREISLVLGDQETGIVSITQDGEIEDREVDVYDLGGRKVAQSVAGSTCLMNLPAGVYVVNGKKYVIK